MKLLKGDVFTIEGLRARNPINGRRQEWLEEFVVVADTIVATLPPKPAGRRSPRMKIREAKAR